MRIFVVSDTHDVPISELELIAQEAKKRDCECIIHCGDLEDDHLGHPALGDLPIWVYLTNLNERIPDSLPPNWRLLQNDQRQVIEFGTKKKTRIYVNHYLGIEVLRSQLGYPSLQAASSELVKRIRRKHGPEIAELVRQELDAGLSADAAFPKVVPFLMVDKIRREFGEIHYVLFGHSHHQFFHVNRDTALINPGAFGKGFRDYKRSYAVVDTKTWDVIFSKVLAP